MVEHSSDVVMLINAAGQILYASPGLVSTLGHRSENWIGRPLIDLVAADDREASALELQRGRTTRSWEHGEVRGQPRASRRPAAADGGHDRQPARWRRGGRDRRHVPRRHRTAQPRAAAQPSRVPRRVDRAGQSGSLPRPDGSRPACRPAGERSAGRVVRRPRRLQVGQRRSRPWRGGSVAALDRRPDQARHGDGRHTGPARRRRVRHPPRGQRWSGSGDRCGRTTAGPAPRARQPGRIRTRRVGQRRGRGRFARHDHLRPAARRGHRHVRGETGGQEPDQDLRSRDAAAGHAASRVPHGAELGDRARSDAPHVPTDGRSPHRSRRGGGGAHPLGSSRARRDCARRVHPRCRTRRTHRPDR